MSASALLLVNFAREILTDVLIALFYVGFGHFILGVRQRPRRVALACTINAISHFLSRHLLFSRFFPICSRRRICSSSAASSGIRGAALRFGGRLSFAR